MSLYSVVDRLDMPEVFTFLSTRHQVLDTLSSGGGPNLNDSSLLQGCGSMVALTVFWRMVHYVSLKHAMF